MQKAKKKDIIEKIAMENGVSKVNAEHMYYTVINAIVELMSDNDGVSCTGLGTFKWHKRHARRARNPKTGEAVWVDEKMVVKFRPGPKLSN